MDLHPAGLPSYGGSRVYGLNATTEVGWIETFSSTHAALWHGSAASMVDLNPSGAFSSAAFAIMDGYVAGSATFGLSTHAGIWSGTAASFFDLHAALGPGFTYSQAAAIWMDGANIMVAGSAGGSGYARAVFWKITPVPEPSALTLAAIAATALLVSQRGSGMNGARTR
ncbi:MAG: hypothetical protein H7X97_06865 [Opitutaceae bacterium]|nr:hypothetical protein [Verrucomicrobiales bacterium]